MFIGAAIGSFLNVVIYRMPRGLGLGKPKHSFCPRCEHRLTAPDLVPLFSWLVLRGRCRHCKARVPSRYFWVELLTGSLFAIVWRQYLVADWDPIRALVLAAFCSALVAAIFIDFELYIIPDQINAFMLFLGLAYNGWTIARGLPGAWAWGMPSAVAGALIGVVALWAIAFLGRLFFGKDAMGHGDIKMARGIGAVLGPSLALMGFGLAVPIGVLMGVGYLAFRVLFQRGASPPDEEPEDEVYVPESIPSLLKCGLGYVLCIDVIGLFAPKLYISWFGEDPYAVEAMDEEAEVETTMIPFGPSLAIGALTAALFEGPIRGLIASYWAWATGEKSPL